MKTKLKYGTLIALTTVLAACGSTPKEPETTMPAWVMNPVVEDGISSTECVIWSGNFSTDKAQASSLSRTALAQQIETRVKALDKTYQEKIEVDSGVQTGSTFTSVSKQLTNQSLQGSKPVKVDFATFDGKKHLCVMTALGASSTKELFDSLVNKTEKKLMPDQEQVLYQEFKAHKAQQELEAEMEKNKD